MAAAPRTAGPGTSLALDLLCAIPAILVLIRRVIDPTYVIRWSWSLVAMGALALWMLLSVMWAGNKFVALVGAMNFVTAMVIIWSAAQLVRSWGRLRVVAGLAFGVLLIYAAAGLKYRYSDLPMLKENFEKNREQILRDERMEPGSFAARQFENKVVKGDIGCFTSSPNTYAAAIVLLAVLSGGIIAHRLAAGDGIGWSIAMGAAFPFVVVVLALTHSRTAGGMAVLAVVLLLAMRYLRGWMSRHSTGLYCAGAAAMVLGAGSVVGHALKHGNLVEQEPHLPLVLLARRGAAHRAASGEGGGLGQLRGAISGRAPAAGR